MRPLLVALALVGLVIVPIVVGLLRTHRRRRSLDFDHGFEVWVSEDNGTTWRLVKETSDFVAACEASLDCKWKGCQPFVTSARSSGGDYLDETVD